MYRGKVPYDDIKNMTPIEFELFYLQLLHTLSEEEKEFAENASSQYP